jgi:signal transduction histidine kinase
VQLVAEATPHLLRVTIHDDGRGFVVGGEPADANGLRNLRERMQGAGGRCRIESRPGEGTRVTLELPFN